MECYFINLQDDVLRKQETIHELRKIGNIKINRFNAINGTKEFSSGEYDNHLSNIGKIICTPKMIGCGLSHIMLANVLHTELKHDYTIIFEDDIKIDDTAKTNIRSIIVSIVKRVSKMDRNWDIIKLIDINSHIVHGSSAAYIISKKGIEKLKNMKLKYHIDIQMNNGFNVHYINNHIFTTRDNDIQYTNPFLNYELFGQKVGWYLNQDFIRIFILNVKFYHLFIFLFIITLYSIYEQSYSILLWVTIVLLSFFIYIVKLSNLV
jgi:GR25 family glycosyltransferase involved in LPS biosynthesis